MDIRTGYKNDEKLRKSLNDLAEETFGLDLESWYKNGFWQNDYIPWSAVEDGKVISNISVSVCNMKWRGQIRHLAQLCTVMTGKDHRGQGYSRMLMEKVLADCERSFDGVYLYAEDHMTGFYEKFGFKVTPEYRCRKKVNITQTADVEKIPMDTIEDWERMVDIINRRKQYGERIMVNNPGLFMFHLTGPMSGCVYYLPSLEAYVVADVSGDKLTLHAVFSDDKASLGEVISSFGKDIRQVELSFTPENNTGFELCRINDPESVFLTKGSAFDKASSEKYMFPEISRA